MKGFRVTLYGWYLLLMAFIAISILCCLIGCRSTSTIEKEKEISRGYQLTDMMDSLLKSTSRIQQDFYQRQTSLIDSIRQMERNDSSHSVVINEKGDTIRETFYVERVKEREHSTESKERELISHIQSEVDSLIRLSSENKELIDSLLKEHNKETVIVKEPSMWQKIKSAVGGYAIVLSIILIGIYVLSRFRRKPIL